MTTTLQSGSRGAGKLVLDRRTYFIKEHIGTFKLHEAYDILDAESGGILATAREEASFLKKLLKLAVNKRMLPFTVHLRDGSGEVLLTITRGFTILRSRVEVLDADGQVLGTFKQKLLSIGGKFDILSPDNVLIAQLKGNLIGWDFKFVAANGKELGSVTKKWSGIGRELFTSADNYVVAMSDDVDPVATGPVLLAAALCIDMVLKEK